VAGLLVLGTAAPAHADSVVIDNTSTSNGSFCALALEPVGQTFIATATGAITEVGFLTGPLDEPKTMDLRIRADGAGGTIIGSRSVTFTKADALNSFTIDPVGVVEGKTYAVELSDWRCPVGNAFISYNDAFPTGTLYDRSGPKPIDLVFRVVIETSTDDDGDGVLDAQDVCADTSFSASPDLKPNHYWSTSADGFVDRSGAVAYTLAEAGGCSAEQIIAAAGLGKGHLKSGLSIGELRKWIASVSAPAAP